MDRINTQVLQFLEEEGVDTSEVNDSTLLFSTGVVDSFTLVSLMTFLEETFSLRIDPSDVALENFDSIDFMVDYVKRLKT